MAENTAIRILVVDDHPVLRDGVAAILETQSDMTLVGEARDGAEAIVRFRELKPDVTLMDLQMPGLGGVDAITAIRAEFPNARFLVLTTYDGDVQAVRALKAGALGFLLKSSLRTEMLEAIRDVHRGRGHIHRDVASEIASHIANDPLTAREVTVLRLVAMGKANKQVAYELGLAEETIKAHLKTIFLKLDVADRTHAVTVAAKRGIIEL
jgi:DNA-binding NarL/FixJ family response regulator